VVASEDFVKAHGLPVLGRIASWGFAGLEPERMGLGPSRSTPVALKKAGLSMDQIGLVEMNEAFAAQVLANLRAFERDSALGEISGRPAERQWRRDRARAPGGLLGHAAHPHAALEMRRHRAHGLATLCIGGGQGASIILEAR
jgi:acetyl-CoA acyltransferase